MSRSETAADKASRTHEAARKAARHAEAASYAADVALIARVGALAAYKFAYQSKCDLAAEAVQAEKDSEAASDAYLKDVKARQKAANVEARRIAANVEARAADGPSCQ